ncbi:MAG TPA: hypothetical protein VMS17_06445 [Gemmataceae bacterium]|nr:hypothetical protein [Gemmataceae bacterium]
MATVRISGNLHSHHQTEWVGAPAVSPDGRIERSVPLSDEAYDAIERQMAGGAPEGIAVLADGRTFHWFLDGSIPRGAGPATASGRTGGFDQLRVLLPDIDRIARGELDGSERQTDVIRLLAYVVAELLRSSEDAANS